MKRRSLLHAALATAATGISATTFAQEKFTYSGPVITLRHSHFAPANHPMSKAVGEKWLAMVEKVLTIRGQLPSDIANGIRNCFKLCQDASAAHIGLL